MARPLGIPTPTPLVAPLMFPLPARTVQPGLSIVLSSHARVKARSRLPTLPSRSRRHPQLPLRAPARVALLALRRLARLPPAARPRCHPVQSAQATLRHPVPPPSRRCHVVRAGLSPALTRLVMIRRLPRASSPFTKPSAAAWTTTMRFRPPFTRTSPCSSSYVCMPVLARSSPDGPPLSCGRSPTRPSRFVVLTPKSGSASSSTRMYRIALHSCTASFALIGEQGDVAVVAVWDAKFVQTKLMPAGRFLMIRGFGIKASSCHTHSL